MVSLYGYNESYDYKQMYDFTDWRCPVKEATYPEGTIMWFIASRPCFSKIKFIIETAQMQGVFGTCSFKDTFTLFIPTDENITLSDNVIKNMDKYTARQIILYSSTNNLLYWRFLRSSPIIEINTRIPSSKLIVQNKDTIPTYILGRGANCLEQCGLTINGLEVLKSDIKLKNGLIHIISGLLLPDTFAMQNDDQ